MAIGRKRRRNASRTIRNFQGQNQRAGRSLVKQIKTILHGTLPGIVIDLTPINSTRDFHNTSRLFHSMNYSIQFRLQHGDHCKFLSIGLENKATVRTRRMVNPLSLTIVEKRFYLLIRLTIFKVRNQVTWTFGETKSVKRRVPVTSISICHEVGENTWSIIKIVAKLTENF